jgi:antibiotic biosynthesis monooxygenase (ABM) superfamily enzyme
MPAAETPVLVAVVRRVPAAEAAAMDADLRAFLAYAAQHPGYEGMQVLRREAAGTVEFTVLARFASAAARAAFKAAPDYPAWLARLDARATHPVAVQELHGLEAWFAVPDTATAPKRWKMAAITYVGVNTVVLVLSPLAAPFLTPVPFPFSTLVLNVAVVASLTWLVMPRLTRWAHPWLFS